MAQQRDASLSILLLSMCIVEYDTRAPNQPLDPRQTNPQTNKQTNKHVWHVHERHFLDTLPVSLKRNGVTPRSRDGSAALLEKMRKRSHFLHAQTKPCVVM